MILKTSDQTINSKLIGKTESHAHYKLMWYQLKKQNRY